MSDTPETPVAKKPRPAKGSDEMKEYMANIRKKIKPRVPKEK